MNCDTKIAAGIVTYNPDQWDRYENGIKKILEQVDKIYVFNNGDKLDNISDARIDVFSENENKGVAYALNRIMNKAKNDGYVWVLTMDQDSLIPDGLVNEYRTAIDNNENIGIVCPQVIDIRRNYMNISKEPKQALQSTLKTAKRRTPHNRCSPKPFSLPYPKVRRLRSREQSRFCLLQK